MNDARAIERVRQMVVDHTLYFASARSFNDPFDLNPVFSLRASAVDQRADYRRLSHKYDPELSESEREKEANTVMATSLAPDTVDSTAQAIQFHYRQYILDGIGTFCLSAKNADLLMWAHYGDSHRGVCLQFDAEVSVMAEAQAVKYVPKRVPLNRYAHAREEMMTNALLTKSDHWAYEEEWRALRSGSPGPVKIDPGCLTGIVIGGLASAKTIAAVRDMARQRGTPIALYHAVTSTTEYEIRIEPLARATP
jgi:hypothetical protein